jgi:hypothetical protein
MNRLEETVGRTAFGLLGGRTIERPLLGIFKLTAEIFNDHRFTA